MSKKILKIFSALIFWGIFVYVILFVNYPQSITGASSLQLLAFFVPLFLALTFTFNLFLKFLLSSSFLALSAILMLFLKALDILNFVSAGLIIVAVGLLLSYFRKVKQRSGLTSTQKISKLTHLRRKDE